MRVRLGLTRLVCNESASRRRQPDFRRHPSNHFAGADHDTWTEQWPRRTQTYAIRLAVEGGGQVKAELVSVGQSGEQSLKRIESAGERASGGLKGLGRQAELLRTGIRTLGGALIGAATVGGLAALGRSLDLGGGCHRQDRRQDRRRRRGAAGAALRRQGVGRRAADARHGAATLRPPSGRGRQRHVWASRCATRDDRARSS